MSAASLCDRGCSGIDTGRLRQVAGNHTEHEAALCDDHVARRRERTLITSGDRQEGAFRGERKRRTASDAAARAGDVAVPAGKSEVHDLLPFAKPETQPKTCSFEAGTQRLTIAAIQEATIRDIRSVA